MKARHTLFGLMATVLGLASCSQEEMNDPATSESQNGQTITTLTATMPEYVAEDGTRATFSSDLQSMTWEAGDKFGIHYKTSKG